ARQEAYQDARRRAGIIREAVWIQPAPGGDVAVVYLEADDLATALTILGTSAEPFDRWFRDHARQVHGIAWEEEFTAPELVLDFDTSSAEASPLAGPQTGQATLAQAQRLLDHPGLI